MNRLNILGDILRNRVVLSTLLGWLVGQGCKVLVGIWREKRFNFKWFVGTGGMPSAHSAGAAALATAVGLKEGFGSAFFAIAFAVAIVAMFDAQGVRRAAGRQAETLNKILEDIYWKGKVKEDRLKELVGHTPIEVFVGAALGILIAVICHKIRIGI